MRRLRTRNRHKSNQTILIDLSNEISYFRQTLFTLRQWPRWMFVDEIDRIKGRRMNRRFLRIRAKSEEEKMHTTYDKTISHTYSRIFVAVSNK